MGLENQIKKAESMGTQTETAAHEFKSRFEVNNPDFTLSPMTGMTRQHYIDCARYILERAFKHVKSFDQPIVFPTIPGSKSYPQPDDPPWRARAHEWEALERTFNLAAPLMHVDPEISINGIKLRDYYSHHSVSYTHLTLPTIYSV